MKPSKRARLSPEERERAHATFIADTRAFYLAIARERREEAIARGSPRYIWLAGEAANCELAARKNGCVFSFDQPPDGGHPHEGDCLAADWCRCVAIPVGGRLG